MASHIHHNLVRGKIRGEFYSAFTEDSTMRASWLTLYGSGITASPRPSGSDSFRGLDWKRDYFEVGELLAFQGREFLEIVYLAILKRHPDPAGIQHYTSFLNKGGNPRLVIEALRHSPEGEQIGVKVNGTRSAIKFKLFSRPSMRLRMALAKR